MSDTVLSSAGELTDCEEIYTPLQGDEFQRLDQVWLGMQCLNNRMESVEAKVDLIVNHLGIEPPD